MFSGATQAVRRFSLLLLEEGELYVADWVASARWPGAVPGNWQRLPRLPGTLRLGTKSLFFEPDDPRVPIVRLPFQHVEGLEGSGDRRLVLAASRVIKMRANAADAPYVVERAGQGQGQAGSGSPGTLQAQQAQQGAQQAQQVSHQSSCHQHQHGPHLFHWEFELAYASLEGVMPLAQQMMVASRLPAAEQEAFLQAAMADAEAGLRFDVGLLRNPGERIVAELECTLLSQGALVREPGRLLVTDHRLYFQPLHSISGDAAVSSHPLAAVAAAARRRSALRDVALEVFFSEPPEQAQHLAPLPFWGGTSALFAFGSREERERAVEALTSQSALGAALPGGREAAAAFTAILEADPSWLSRVTAAWQRGRISNLDYLLFLNLASGRTFADLSQYPVFPWVLSDYASPTLDLSNPASFRDLSRPVGALNSRRLQNVRERYTEMAGFSHEPCFLWGSHYSTPGFTMFWLVRAAPAHMLRLQNGRFDSPDRLFCSVREAWEGVTSSNPADVKELTPEFFLRHDFLLNRRNLALGTRQSGRPVGDVELPAWAHSPQHFMEVLRCALEAPYVSANLHHWIDLIFGFKQRGEAAVEADNVFRHTAYEGAVDIEAVADRTERIALETQIQEFGQVPRQLFHLKHPQRLVCPPTHLPSPGDTAAAAAAGAAAGAGGASGADSGGSTASQTLPLALVSTILAAAAEGQHSGESPRLEVSPLLAQLDVMTVRRQQEREQAAAAAEAAAAAAAAEGGGTSAGPSSQQQQQQQQEEQLTAAAGGGSGRLRSLGAWAAERKQAVGERLAGSVGVVRDALAAAPQGSSASASRLQGLFTRKASASSTASSLDLAGAASSGASFTGPEAAATAASVPVLMPAAGSQLQPGRSLPQPPAARVAAGLGSLGGKLSSMSLRSPQQAADGSSLAATAGGSSGGLSAGAGDAADEVARQAAGTAAAGPKEQAQVAPGAEAAAAAGEAAASPLWKFSRRTTGPTYAGRTAMSAEDSSDDEASAAQHGQHGEHGERGQRGGMLHGSSPQGQLGQRPGSASSALLEAQRQRMLASSGATSAGVGIGSGSRPGSARGASGRGWYGPGLRDRLRPTRVLAAGGESVNGCALAASDSDGSGSGTGSSEGDMFAYSASHSGSVRVHSLGSGEQVRAARLSEQPLTCVALLPLPAGDASGRRHPTVLCGSFDASIHVYSPDYGRQLGSFQAAADAIACLQVMPGSGSSSSACRLLSGSWDGSVKLWDLAEGRQPWEAGMAQPVAEVAAPSSVWAAAASEDGNLLLAGTEDGLVAAWDLRCPPSHSLWQHQLVSDNYIGGLEWVPGGASGQAGASSAVVAAADGSLTLLDLRRLGEGGGTGVTGVAAKVCPSGMPLRCCATDGRLVLAGDEGGELHMWDVAGQLGEPASQAPGAWTQPQPNGLYPPLLAAPPSAVTALAVAPSSGGSGSGVVVATAHEGGLIRCYSTAAS